MEKSAWCVYSGLAVLRHDRTASQLLMMWLSIEYFEMLLLPFVCLQFWVFSSCQCQKQTSVKQSTYCSFTELEEELLSDFSFRYFHTTTKAAHTGYEMPTRCKSDCWTKDSVHLVNPLNSVCVSLAGSPPRLIGQSREIFPVSSLEKQKMSDSHLVMCSQLK